MTLPKVTIITVCFNAVKEIEATLRSVIAQDYPTIEYIVVDGGSTDGTVSVIEKYINDISCYVSEKDLGVYDAMNKGAQMATGKWVNFMNAGDRFHSNSVLSQLALHFREDAETDVVYGDTCLYLENKLYYIAPAPLTQFSTQLPFCHQSAFVKTSILKKNPFNLNYKIAADYAFFLGQYRQSPQRFTYVPVIVSDYDTNAGFSLKNNLKCVKEQADISGFYQGLFKRIKFMLICCKTYLVNLLPQNFRETRRKNYIRRKFQCISGC